MPFSIPTQESLAGKVKAGFLSGVSGVYVIRNTMNGKVYVGSAATLKERFAMHRSYLRRGKHYNPHLQRAWDKYGEGAFEIKTLLVCSKENLTFYEQRVMDALGACDKLRGYNVLSTAGSSLGYKHSAESLEKMRCKRRPRGPYSPEHRAAISAGLTGKSLTPEHRAAVSSGKKAFHAKLKAR